MTVAVPTLPFPRQLRNVGLASLATFSAAAVGAGLGRALVTTYLPVLLDRIRDAPGLIGTVMLVNTVAGFAVPLWVGVWSDSLRGRGHGRTLPFVLGGSLVASGGLLAVALGHATSYAALAVFAAVVYVGLNMVTTAHRALIPETFSERRRAAATGSEELAMLVGTLVGVVTGGVLLEVAAWGPFAFGAVLLPLLALPTVRRMRGRETAQRPARPRPTRPLRYYVAAASRPGARVILAAQILWVLGYVGLAPFFMLYAKEVVDLRPSAAAALLGAFGVLAGLSVIGAGAIPPEQQIRSLVGGVVLMGGGLLGVAATTSLQFIVPLLLAAAVGFGIVTTLGFAVFTAYIPAGEEGAYSALFFSARSIASAVAVPATGWTIALAETYRAIFVLSGTVTLLALVPLSVLTIASRRPRRPRPRDVIVPLVALAVGTASTLAAGIAVANSRLARADETVFDTLYSVGSAPRWLDAVLVDPHIQNYVALTLVAAAVAIVWRRDQLTAVAALVPLAGFLSFAIVRLLWAVWDRARPEEVLGIDGANGHIWASYPSFPSGHVVVTVALVAAAVSRIRALAVILWPYAAVVAVTRVVYGAHFPFDVAAGAALGYGSARAAASLLAAIGVLAKAWTPAVDATPFVRFVPTLTDERLRRAARVWTAVAVVAFGILAATVGPPQAPEGGVLPTNDEEAIQLALLALAAAGATICRYRDLLGAAMLLSAALALGVLASVEYHPLFAFGACAVFFAPGALLLAVWARQRGVRAVAVVSGVAVALLAAGGAAAFDLHARAYGPTHPASSLRAQPSGLVRWMWSGGVMPTSARVTAKLARDTGARLVVSRYRDLREAVRSNVRTADHDRNDRIVSFRVRGLTPSTRYFYAVEARDRQDRSPPGRFETPPGGPASFTFAFGGCARVGSNGAVFDAIRARDPLFFLILGDFFYANIDTDDPEAFRNQYETALSQPAQAALYRSTAVDYVWDDHDFGGNDSGSSSSSKPAALSTYRNLAPHYRLRDRGAIYHSFSVGRVRFVVTDTRSARTAGTMLGARQKAWLKRELLDARRSGQFAVWVNSVPWISATGADSWAGYPAERRELADFVARHRIRNLLMLSGDAHMVAIDNGRNNRYATLGDGSFPVMHAAALDRRGELKGGPYSEGAFAGSGQFGTVTVGESGSSRLTITLEGWNYRGQRLVSYTFTRELPEARS